MHASMQLLVQCCLIASPFGDAQGDPRDASQPLVVASGVHLLVDDLLVERSDGVVRRVIQPQRFLAKPIVTGAADHQNWQPFLTVLHDPTWPKHPFRLWYNVDVVDDPADGNFFGKTGYLESTDGLRWPGPYERMESLAEDGRVRFGACVLDDGSQHRPASERYKMLYFDAGKQVGPRVAFSADGRKWTRYDDGRPVLRVNNGDDIWSAAYDPLRRRYFLIGKTYGPHTWTNTDGKEVTATIRRYFTSFSDDFKTWSEPQMVFSPDDRDEGITQWYGAAGFQVRGDMIVGFLRVLRDDLSPEGVPAAAVEANIKGKAGLGGAGEGMGSGMGYTVLTWTRDGRTWQRDRHGDKFFQPDSRVGAWDHAMAWIGSSAAVDDELYLYYAGYRWGHKFQHSVDRQLGVVKMQRDRYVAREAGETRGTLSTPLLRLDAESLALNVAARHGEVRVQIADADGKPIPSFRFEDCQAISADALTAPVTWAKPLATLRGRNVRLEFSLTIAQLFALETR